MADHGDLTARAPSQLPPPPGELPGRLPPAEWFPAGDPRFRTRYVEVATTTGDSVRIRTIECGDPDAASVAVCVHGWSCLAYSFRDIMPPLAERGTRAIAFDLPGAGLSDKPDTVELYTLEGLVHVAFSVMDALGVARAVLVGHSMGGPIIAQMALDQPDRVAGLALLAPAGYGREWSVRLGRWVTPRVVAPLLPYVVPRWAVRLVLGVAFGTLRTLSDREIDEYWAPSQYRGFTRAQWDLLHVFAWSAGADGRFTRVATPTVVVDGSRDHMVVRRWVRRYARTMPHATYVEIPGAGHVVAEEAPDAVLDAILPLFAHAGA